MKFDELVNLCESNNITKHIKYYEDLKGNKTDIPYEIKYYNQQNLLHREDGPAHIRYWANGKKRWEAWMQNGERYRTDGPSYIQYFDDGQVDFVAYEKNGKYHRLDGPAWESYYPNGRVFEMRYYIHDKRYTKKEFDEYVKGLDSKEDKELLGDLGQTFE